MLNEYIQSIGIELDTSEAEKSSKELLASIQQINETGHDIDISALERSLVDSKRELLAFEAAMERIGKLESFKDELLSLGTNDAFEAVHVIDEQIDRLKLETDEKQKQLELDEQQQEIEDERIKRLEMRKKLEEDLRKMSSSVSADDVLEAEEKRKAIQEEIANKELMISRLRGVGSKAASAEQKRLEDEVAKLKRELNDEKQETKADMFKNAFLGNSQVAQKASALKADPLGTMSRDAGKGLAKVLDGTAEQFKSVFGSGTQQLKTMFLGSWNSLGDVLSSAFEEFNDIISSSYLTNDTTWNNATEYGMSAAESYAFEKAKAMLGVTDDSLERMTASQKQIFNDLFKKYQGKYNDLYDSGFFDEMTQANIEAQEFQEDLKLSLVTFFVNNKDTIMAALEGMIALAEKLLKGASWLFGNKSKTSTASSMFEDVTFSFEQDTSTTDAINNMSSMFEQYNSAQYELIDDISTIFEQDESKGMSIEDAMMMFDKDSSQPAVISDAAQTMFSDVTNTTNSSVVNNNHTKVDVSNTFNAQNVDAQSIQNIPATYWSSIAAQITA